MSLVVIQVIEVAEDQRVGSKRPTGPTLPFVFSLRKRITTRFKKLRFIFSIAHMFSFNVPFLQISEYPYV